MRLNSGNGSVFSNQPCERDNYTPPLQDSPHYLWNLFLLLILAILTTVLLVVPPAHAEGAAVAAAQAASCDTSPSGAPPAYVGADKCKMCHMDRFKTWSMTGMSKAWDRIKDQPDKEKCLACHTTGYGRPGGFQSAEATPNLLNVQCEVCHGPGGAHTALPISQKDPAVRRATINKFIQDCRACHSPHVPNKAAAARAGSGS